MCKKNFGLINKDILKEIERKKSILERNPLFTLCISSRKKRLIQKESAKHSVEMEVHGRSKLRKSKKEIYNALKWGLDNYNGKLDKNFIFEIGKRVDSTNNSFRNCSARTLDATMIYPSPDKFEREFLSFLSVNKMLSNPLEKAFDAHYHIARIHPFYDGNGRTSRLIQNIILEKEGYFPIFIKPFEKEEYLDLIQKAQMSRWFKTGKIGKSRIEEVRNANEMIINNNLPKNLKGYYENILIENFQELMTPEQNEFYNFLALKIRDVLQTQIEDCSNYKRRYKKK